MPRLEDDVKHWARGYLEALGFDGLTGEGSKLPKSIRDRFTSKTGSGKGYVDLAGDFRPTKGFILITETKAPDLFDEAVQDLKHYLDNLQGLDVVGWATDGKKGLWIIRSQDGKEDIINECYNQRP